MSQDKLAYKEYIENLDIGDDGTLFEAPSPAKAKYYGLSFLFNCALSLKYYGEGKEQNQELRISYDELLLYLKNAEYQLRIPKKYEKDPLVENPYNLKVYKNPNNYSVLSKQEYKEFYQSLNNSKRIDALNNVLNKYKVNPVILYKKDYHHSEKSKFLVFPRDINRIEFVDINNLTAREIEAFFGEEAQRILGVKINREEQNIQIISSKNKSKLK